MLAAVLPAAPCLAQTADWLTFGGSAMRQGFNPGETVLSQATVSSLKLHWTQHITGVIEVQMTSMHDVPRATGAQALVFATTIRGKVAALDAATGAKVWQSQMGAIQVCDMPRWRGVDQTPTIDRDALRMYLVDATGMLHALDVRTGAEIAPFPVQVIDPANQVPNTYVHGSPTLVGSTLYLVTSSLCPDKPPFHGQVVAVDTAAATVTGRFYPLGAPDAVTGAGIWGPGGVSAEADGSALFAATGNAKQRPNYQPMAESLVKLDPQLNVQAFHTPIIRNGDFDMDSTPVPYTTPGCPERVAVMGKIGQLFVYDPAAIGAGPLQTVTVGRTSATAWLFGAPAFDPATNALYFDTASDAPDGNFHHGMIALQANSSCLLSTLWNQPVGDVAYAKSVPIPATVANGVVWMSYLNGPEAGIVAFADDTGTVLWDSGTMFDGTNVPGPPMVVNGQVIVGTSKGNVMAFGL